MPIKEQLLKEAKDIEVSVELDSIFESVNLSEEMQQNFNTVFEQTVKAKAVELAEAHILHIAEAADNKVEELVESRVAEVESKLTDIADKMFEHVAAEWLKENQLQVERSIKANLFESMFAAIKTAVIEHDVVIPESSIDVVAELEEDLQEHQDENKNLFNQLTESQSELNALKRKVAVNEATADLTESQQEQVGRLIEGLDWSADFEGKLTSIVAMTKHTRETTPLTEATTPATDINKIEEAAQGLNYKVEPLTENEGAAEPAKKVNPYVAAATKFK